MLAAIVSEISDEWEDRGTLLQTVETMPLIRSLSVWEVDTPSGNFYKIQTVFVCSKKFSFEKKVMTKLKKLPSAPL